MTLRMGPRSGRGERAPFPKSLASGPSLAPAQGVSPTHLAAAGAQRHDLSTKPEGQLPCRASVPVPELVDDGSTARENAEVSTQPVGSTVKNAGSARRGETARSRHAPGTIRCAKCGGRVRYRRVRDDRYEPAEEFAFPERCSHCGARPTSGCTSIAVVVGD